MSVLSAAERSPARQAHPRIAVVAAALDILGGQGIQAVELIEALRTEGIGVTFIPINPAFPPGLRRVRRWPYARTLLNQAFYLPGLARLRGADVAHVFSASYWSFLLGPVPAMLAARALGKRVVLHYHSGEAEDHLRAWGTLVHPWLRLADAIVVPSEYLRGIFERHGYRPHVIPNVVSTARLRYRERTPPRPRLLSTRNLEPHYRVDNTLRAFALIRKRYPEATLTVAGYGSQETGLRRLARLVGEEGIRFVGRVEPDVMPALYDHADVFVNSSVVDNQPVSILEALASGLPVVSTGAGDIPRMLRHGAAGLIVGPCDPQAMAAAVVRLLEDRDLAARLTRCGLEEVRAYAWPEVRRAWEVVYRGGEA